jgi:hypothetical protein
MPNVITTYKGFELNATAHKILQGFVSQVCLTQSNGSNTNGRILAVPTPATLYKDSDAARYAAIGYGRAAIDGLVPGVDLSDLF